MRGNILIYLFSVILLIISGCTQEVQTNVGGVDMQFLDSQPLIPCLNEPGYCLQDGEGFTVGIKLINNLLHEVEGASVCISDTASDSIGGISSQRPCLDGISVPPAQESGNRIVPGTYEIYFPESGGSYYYRGIDRGNEKTSIYAELRYPVESTFKVNDVCVKRNPGDEVDFTCNSQESFSGASIQGDIAPVRVESVTKAIVGIPNNNQKTKIRLNIRLKKALQGEVQLENSEDNFLYMEITLGNSLESFQCKNMEGNMLEIKEATKEVQCEGIVDLGGEVAFKDAINIDLRYDYYVLMSSGVIKLTEGIS